ncbi:hypothetical protein [Polynucleobacter sp. MWH-UH23A]|uniref:hypothetical protein n=1 Tax=Polynucleobacter sp. MWH-UH23A TaxID=1855613 RepID=UPI0033650379
MLKNYINLLHRHLLLLPILIFSALLMKHFITNDHDWGDDFAQYIWQALTIVYGGYAEFMQTNTFIINNSSFVIGSITYPWGVPLVLSLIYRVNGMDLIAFKYLGFFSYLLFLLTIYIGFLKYFPKKICLIVVAYFAINPFWVDGVNTIVSDIPFLFLSTVCIFLMNAIVVSKQVIFTKVIDQFLLGILIFTAFLVRNNGVLLLVNLFFIQLIGFWQHRKWFNKSQIRQEVLITSIPFGVFIFLLIAEHSFLPNGDSTHIHFLMQANHVTVFKNFIYTIRLPRFFFGSPWLYIATIFPVILGVRKTWRQSYCYLIYMSLTLALYSLWPAHGGPRFIFPILPLYFFYLVVGVLELSKRMMNLRGPLLGSHSKVIAYALSGLFMVSSIAYGYADLPRNVNQVDGPYSQSTAQVVNFLEKNTRIDDVIIFRKPRVMYLLSSRKSVLIDNEAGLEMGDYLVLDLEKKHDQSQISLNSAVLSKLNEFMVFKNEQFVIYKLKGHQKS